MINIFTFKHDKRKKVCERIKVIVATSTLKKEEDSSGNMVSLYGEKYWIST